MRAPEDNKPAGGEQPRQPSRAELTDANAAMAARIAEMEALLAAKSAETDALAKAAAERPAQSELVDAHVLLTGLRYEGKDYAIDTVMPFDPTHPPKGCDGLEEGVHYTKAKRLR